MDNSNYDRAKTVYDSLSAMIYFGMFFKTTLSDNEEVLKAAELVIGYLRSKWDEEENCRKVITGE